MDIPMEILEVIIRYLELGLTYFSIGGLLIIVYGMIKILKQTIGYSSIYFKLRDIDNKLHRNNLLLERILRLWSEAMEPDPKEENEE